MGFLLFLPSVELRPSRDPEGDRILTDTVVIFIQLLL